MGRVQQQRARPASAGPAVTRHKELTGRTKPSYKVVLEQVTQKKRKLVTVGSSEVQPPPGYTFIPLGDPPLTNECKELARLDGETVYLVSTCKSQTNELSRQVNRAGHHFPSSVVARACMRLGIDITRSGHVLHRNGGFRIEAPRKKQVGLRLGASTQNPEALMAQQNRLNEQAEAAIRDLFPKIPREDLLAVVHHAFELGKERVGSVAELSLTRRVQLAVIAHIRHRYTEYDKLLKQYSWVVARSIVEPITLEKVAGWRGEDDDDPTVVEDILREVIVIPDDESDDDHHPLGAATATQDLSNNVLKDLIERRLIDHSVQQLGPNASDGNDATFVGHGQYAIEKRDRARLERNEEHRRRAWQQARDRYRKPHDQQAPMAAPVTLIPLRKRYSAGEIRNQPQQRNIVENIPSLGNGHCNGSVTSDFHEENYHRATYSSTYIAENLPPVVHEKARRMQAQVSRSADYSQEYAYPKSYIQTSESSMLNTRDRRQRLDPFTMVNHNNTLPSDEATSRFHQPCDYRTSRIGSDVIVLDTPYNKAPDPRNGYYLPTEPKNVHSPQQKRRRVDSPIEGGPQQMSTPYNIQGISPNASRDRMISKIPQHDQARTRQDRVNPYHPPSPPRIVELSSPVGLSTTDSLQTRSQGQESRFADNTVAPLYFDHSHIISPHHARHSDFQSLIPIKRVSNGDASSFITQNSGIVSNQNQSALIPVERYKSLSSRINVPISASTKTEDRYYDSARASNRVVFGEPSRILRYSALPPSEVSSRSYRSIKPYGPWTRDLVLLEGPRQYPDLQYSNDPQTRQTLGIQDRGQLISTKSRASHPEDRQKMVQIRAADMVSPTWDPEAETTMQTQEAGRYLRTTQSYIVPRYESIVRRQASTPEIDDRRDHRLFPNRRSDATQNASQAIRPGHEYALEEVVQSAPDERLRQQLIDRHHSQQVIVLD